MKGKPIGWNALVCALLIACAAVAVLGLRSCAAEGERAPYADGIEQIDLNTIRLQDSRVTVSFSDVILAKQNERHQLIVSEQEATVETDLTSRLIEKLDFDFLKKTQKVSYTGKGYFVVDLDAAHLGRGDISQDEAAKTVTVRIGHAHLESIEIDPDHILIEAVQEGLLARGAIKLTVEDYRNIEREIRTRLEAAFNTAENAQRADDLALRMVRELYEPIVQAVDARYRVQVVFR